MRGNMKWRGRWIGIRCGILCRSMGSSAACKVVNGGKGILHFLSTTLYSPTQSAPRPFSEQYPDWSNAHVQDACAAHACTYCPSCPWKSLCTLRWGKGILEHTPHARSSRVVVDPSCRGTSFRTCRAGSSAVGRGVSCACCNSGKWNVFKGWGYLWLTFDGWGFWTSSCSGDKRIQGRQPVMCLTQGSTRQMFRLAPRSRLLVNQLLY